MDVFTLFPDSEQSKMDVITLLIGTVNTLSNGATQDDRQEVLFVGKKLAGRTEYGTHKGSLTDTRGVTETLYLAEDGRLVVHVEDWSRWQGEPNIESLHVATEADLQPGGRFEQLGRETGLGRPLTLDEAVAR